MWRLLRNVSVPDYRAAPTRLVLMVGGIAAGVALVAALGVVNASVLANFRSSLERAAGRSALQVVLGSGQAGFAEDVAGLVAADGDVLHAFGVVRGTLAPADAPGEVLELFGIDLASDAVDTYDVHTAGEDIDQLELMNDLTSVLLTEEWAARRGVAVGDRVRFAGPTGIASLRVRGLLRPEGLATALGGNLAVMDLPAAQRLLDKIGRVDQVDVVLRADGLATAVAQRLHAVLPDSLRVERPSFRGERFERVIGAFQAMLDGLSILCLLAGVFIVYNTSATAVTQRARDLAILIAIGADRRRIFALIVSESVVLGVVASVLGVAAGLGIARLVLDLVAQSMGVVYQTRFVVEHFVLTPGQAAVWVTLGTAASVIAALVPARKASRLDPVELMRPDYRDKLAVGVSERALVVSSLLLVGLALTALAVEEHTRSVVWGNASALLLHLAALVASIPAMGALARVLSHVLPRLVGVEGRIAVESLRRAPGRTGVTAAVIGLSLTVAVTVSAVALSFRESERSWFILSGDLVVSSVATEGGWLETPLAADVESLLRAVPGVARVETYRAIQGQELGDARIAVVALSPGFMATPRFRRSIVAGDPAAAVEAVGQGRAVIVSDNLADRLRLAPGDTVSLPTPGGMQAVTVAAVITADYSGDQGSVLLAREQLAAWWGDRQVSHFNLWLEPGADQHRVRAAVVAALDGRYLVKVHTVAQALAYHQTMVDRAFAFTWAIQLLVVAVTLAGIFDLLTTQMLERRQELGIFRALGVEDWRLRRAVRFEAGILGLAGGVLGAVLAVATSAVWVRVNFRILIGYILEHHFPLATALWCVTLAALVAVAAGQLAVRGALREPVLDSLRSE